MLLQHQGEEMNLDSLPRSSENFPKAVPVGRIKTRWTGRTHSTMVRENFPSTLRFHGLPGKREALVTNTAVREEPKVQRIVGGHNALVKQGIATISSNHVTASIWSVMNLQKTSSYDQIPYGQVTLDILTDLTWRKSNLQLMDDSRRNLLKVTLRTMLWFVIKIQAQLSPCR